MSNVNLADDMTKRQMTAIQKIADAANDGIWIPKDPDERADAMKDLGVSSRIVKNLFDRKCLKWGRNDDGDSVLMLTAKCARMLEEMADPETDNDDDRDNARETSEQAPAKPRGRNPRTKALRRRINTVLARVDMMIEGADQQGQELSTSEIEGLFMGQMMFVE